VSRDYGEMTITSQPKTDRRRRSRKPVCLTPAETRVLSLLPTYRTLAAIGTQLGIGRPTVKTHVENIYKKLGASTRAEAVMRAETGGLLPRSVTELGNNIGSTGSQRGGSRPTHRQETHMTYDEDPR
jgi:LuxR family transcriptional regulator, maltose regulon positive regulatory protein